MDEVHSGSSVISQGDLRLHFGLGKVHTVDLIEVKWPTTPKIERFIDVKANQILTILNNWIGSVNNSNRNRQGLAYGCN